MRTGRIDTRCQVNPMATLHVATSDSDANTLLQWQSERVGQVLAIDSETNAEHPWSDDFRLRTVQIADADTAWVLDVEAIGTAWVRRIVRSHPRYVAQYAANEVNFIERAAPGSWRIEDDDPHVVDLQVVMAYSEPRTVVPRNTKEGIDPRIPLARGLKDASARDLSPILHEVEQAMHAHWRAQAPKNHRVGQRAIKWGFANTPTDDPLYLTYAALDPLMTYRLWELHGRRAHERGQWPIVARDLIWQWDADRMTWRGAMADPDYVRWLDGALEAEVDRHAALLAHYGIGRSGAGPAVGAAFEALGAVSPERSAKTGVASWAKGVVKELAKQPGPVGDLATAVAGVRQASKFRSTYVAPLVRAAETDGAVHWQHRVIGATTGRNTAADPPMQQLPKKDTRVRSAFVARPGHVLIGSDFSQGEPRTMAGLSQDVHLAEAILAGDLNSATARAAYGDAYDEHQGKMPGTPHYIMRQNGKIGFLAKCYGAGISRLASSLGVGIEAMREIDSRWEAAFPQLFGLARQLNEQAEVRLESGRICPLWDRYQVTDGGNLVLTSRSSRKGLNYITQGTQRDLLLASWERMRAKGWGSSLWMLVHDEIIISVPEPFAEPARNDLQESMTFTWRGMPFVAEAEILGHSWAPRPEAFHLDGLVDYDDESEIL